MSKDTMKFEFSKELANQLASNSEEWDALLYKACLEGKLMEVKASAFCDTLRATGFRCGTGPARAAYKAVKDGGDIQAMITAVTKVKTNRKSKPLNATLVDALKAATGAAGRDNLVVCESWLVKASNILEAIKAAKGKAEAEAEAEAAKGKAEAEAEAEAAKGKGKGEGKAKAPKVA